MTPGRVVCSGTFFSFSPGGRQFIAEALTAWLLIGVVILALLPSYGVAIPRKRLPLADIIFVGSSSRWGSAGGVVLAAWIYLLLQWLAGAVFHTALKPLTLGAAPNLFTTFNLRVSPFEWARPGWAYLYLAPAVLFVVNLAVVFVRRESAPTVKHASAVR